MFKIMYRYPGCEAEEIDCFDTRAEANGMLAEYRLAMGWNSSLWIEEGEEE